MVDTMGSSSTTAWMSTVMPCVANEAARFILLMALRAKLLLLLEVSEAALAAAAAAS